MNFSNTSAEATTNLSFITDDVFTELTNATENVLQHFISSHINVTYDITNNISNVTKEGVTSLLNATDDVGICDFIISNLTLGNVTTTVTSYNPAACGVYGSYPFLQPLLIFILVCFTLWAIFGNGCLVGVIVTDKNMQEPGNIFLCALAFTDVVQSLMYTPVSILSLAQGEHPGGGCCRMQAFFAPSLSTLCIHLQSSLWICRYIHIAYPYKYQEVLTRGRLALAMTLCFLLAFTPPLAGLARVGTVLTWAVDEISDKMTDAVPFTLMLQCTPGGAESTAAMLLSFLGVVISCCFASLICREARKSQKKHNIKLAWQAQADKLENKLKAAKTLGIVVGVQWCTWIPVIIGAFVRRFGGVTIATTAFYGDIVYVIMQTSTFSDSIVYAFRNRIYRRALARLYRKIRNAFDDL